MEGHVVEDWIRTHVSPATAGTAAVRSSSQLSRRGRGVGGVNGDVSVESKNPQDPPQLLKKTAQSSVFSQEMTAPVLEEDSRGLVLSTNATPLSHLAGHLFSKLDDVTRAEILLGPLLQSHMPSHMPVNEQVGTKLEATSNFATPDSVRQFESMVEMEVSRVQQLANERHVGRVLTPPPPPRSESGADTSQLFPTNAIAGTTNPGDVNLMAAANDDDGLGYSFSTVPGTVIPPIPAQCSSFSGFAATLLEDYVDDGGRLNLGSAGDLLMPIATVGEATGRRSNSRGGGFLAAGGGIGLMDLRPKSNLHVDLEPDQLRQLLPYQSRFLEFGTGKEKADDDDRELLNIEACKEFLDILSRTGVDPIFGPSSGRMKLMEAVMPVAKEEELADEEDFPIIWDSTAINERKSGGNQGVEVLAQGRRTPPARDGKTATAEGREGNGRRKRNREDEDPVLLLATDDEEEGSEEGPGAGMEDPDFDFSSEIDEEELEGQPKASNGGSKLNAPPPGQARDEDEDYKLFDPTADDAKLLQSFRPQSTNIPSRGRAPTSAVPEKGEGMTFSAEEIAISNKPAPTLEMPGELPPGVVSGDRYTVGKNGEVSLKQPKRAEKPPPKKKKMKQEERAANPSRSTAVTPVPESESASAKTKKKANSKPVSRRSSPVPQREGKPPRGARKDIDKLDPYERLEGADGYHPLPAAISYFLPEEYGGTGSSGALPPGAIGATSTAAEQDPDDDKELPDFLMAAIALATEKNFEKKGRKK